MNWTGPLQKDSKKSCPLGSLILSVMGWLCRVFLDSAGGFRSLFTEAVLEHISGPQKGPAERGDVRKLKNRKDSYEDQPESNNYTFEGSYLTVGASRIHALLNCFGT